MRRVVAWAILWACGLVVLSVIIAFFVMCWGCALVVFGGAALGVGAGWALFEVTEGGV